MRAAGRRCPVRGPDRDGDEADGCAEHAGQRVETRQAQLGVPPPEDAAVEDGAGPLDRGIDGCNEDSEALWAPALGW
jgi:hypothetical protein